MALAKFKEMVAERAKQMERINALMKDAFAEGAQELFAEFPCLEGIRWNQYTPYFNDGDTCEFDANTKYCEYKGKFPEKWDYSPYSEDEELEENERSVFGEFGYDARKKCLELKEMLEAVNLFFENFDNDLLKTLFGDHVTVTLTPTGVDTEEYEHD